MEQANLKLYNYFRSSASYRVRIALCWKGLSFEYIPVHLKKGGGEQHSTAYRQLNPIGHVPTLVHNNFVLAESVAIIDYLDRVFPDKPMLPADSEARARTLQICEIVNSGIQPYQNLKITDDFEKSKGWTPQQSREWLKHWVELGLTALEKVLESSSGTHAVGGEITAADAFIVPQCFSSRRFQIDLSKYSVLSRVDKAATSLPAFQMAHPEKQPDFEK